MSVSVLGGSVAGLATALLLARDGHRVTVIERDTLDAGSWQDAPSWDRRGAAHFLQPHAFIPRGRSELMRQLPDVYDALLEAGAYDVDVRPKMPGPAGPAGPDDEELQYLAVRRPLIEWALRRAVHSDAAIQVRDGARVTGLQVESGRVNGVEVDDEACEADLVVDAMGRRSPTASWLGEAPADTSDCGVVYYCRYYRWHPEFHIPDGPWLLSPRGDLGYIAYATFPGDNRTFAALLSVPNGVPEWRAFGATAAFEAAVAQIPMLRMWVDPDAVEPLTDVMPMAGLKNSLRSYDPRRSVGLVPVGDAYCHTDPVLAHGLAFALVHAAEVARALRDHADVGDACGAYADATRPALEERYQFATELDEQRRRMWIGEPVDFAHHDGDYALFSIVAGGVAATVDPEVFRVFVRRIGLLDSTRVLDDDVALRRRIEDLFNEMAATPRPKPGPTREEMQALLAAV